ncbi:MAG: 3'-5' exonuclease, partial [Patescibacteria group bacterium]
MCYEWVDIGNGSINEIMGFCLDKEGKSVLIRVHGYTHSLYIELPTVVRSKRIAWEDGMVSSLMAVTILPKLGMNSPCDFRLVHRRRYNYFRGENLTPFILCKFSTMKQLRIARSIIEEPTSVSLFHGASLKFLTCEGNVDTVLKFLTNRKMEYCQWFTINDETVEIDEKVKISTCKREYRVKYTDIIPIDNKDTKTWHVNPTVLAFDIETYSTNHKAFPNKFKIEDVPYIISAIVQKTGYPETRKRYCVVFGETDDVEIADEIVSVSNEHDLREYFCEIIRKTDPDIITGYNINSFDWSYLDTRLRGIRKWPKNIS